MISQTLKSPVTRLESGRAQRLAARGGELAVVAGRVWLTRRGDLGDHVLTPGQRVRLGPDEEAVIEAWDAAGGASVRWQPRRGGFVGAVLAEPLRGVAFLARSLAAASAAVARRAARAEGRLSGLLS